MITYIIENLKLSTEQIIFVDLNVPDAYLHRKEKFPSPHLLCNRGEQAELLQALFCGEYPNRSKKLTKYIVL